MFPFVVNISFVSMSFLISSINFWSSSAIRSLYSFSMFSSVSRRKSTLYLSFSCSFLLWA